MPNLFFIPDYSTEDTLLYQKGISISELFSENTSGIVTMGDSFVIDSNKDVLQKRLETFLSEEVTESVLNEKYNLGKNYAVWVIGNRKEIIIDFNKIVSYIYRPFDNRFSYFDNKLLWRPRTNTMKHFINGKNIGLIVPKQLAPNEVGGAFITKYIGGHKTFSAFNSNYYFPLYLYSEDGTKVPNLKTEIVQEIENEVGKTEPEEILGYIYAVLHSPAYREKHKEFLKIDFPRVPYPKDKKTFKALVALGTELRLLHLLESPKVTQFITTFPVMEGNQEVEKIKYENGKVWINKLKYFGNVPEIAWNFYIGGYQPAQKWLKDRKGRELIDEDIQHYQKIIVALSETARIMKEIDKVGV